MSCARCPGPRVHREDPRACALAHQSGKRGLGACFPLDLLLLSELSMRKSPEGTSGSNSCACSLRTVHKTAEGMPLLPALRIVPRIKLQAAEKPGEQAASGHAEEVRRACDSGGLHH